MEVIKLENNFEDERGFIRDILAHEEVDSVTIIHSKANCSRANHFHKETIQWNYIMSGKVEYLSQRDGEEVKSVILEKGDLIKTGKMEKHALNAIDDSMILVLTKGPRGGKDYESDTFRLDTPLKLK